MQKSTIVFKSKSKYFRKQYRFVKLYKLKKEAKLNYDKFISTYIKNNELDSKSLETVSDFPLFVVYKSQLFFRVTLLNYFWYIPLNNSPENIRLFAYIYLHKIEVDDNFIKFRRLLSNYIESIQRLHDIKGINPYYNCLLEISNTMKININFLRLFSPTLFDAPISSKRINFDQVFQEIQTTKKVNIAESKATVATYLSTVTYFSTLAQSTLLHNDNLLKLIDGQWELFNQKKIALDFKSLGFDFPYRKTGYLVLNALKELKFQNWNHALKKELCYCINKFIFGTENYVEMPSQVIMMSQLYEDAEELKKKIFLAGKNAIHSLLNFLSNKESASFDTDSKIDILKLFNMYLEKYKSNPFLVQKYLDELITQILFLTTIESNIKESLPETLLHSKSILHSIPSVKTDTFISCFIYQTEVYPQYGLKLSYASDHKQFVSDSASTQPFEKSIEKECIIFDENYYPPKFYKLLCELSKGRLSVIERLSEVIGEVMISGPKKSNLMLFITPNDEIIETIKSLFEKLVINVEYHPLNQYSPRYIKEIIERQTNDCILNISDSDSTNFKTLDSSFWHRILDGKTIVSRISNEDYTLVNSIRFIHFSKKRISTKPLFNSSIKTIVFPPEHYNLLDFIYDESLDEDVKELWWLRTVFAFYGYKRSVEMLKYSTEELSPDSAISIEECLRIFCKKYCEKKRKKKDDDTQAPYYYIGLLHDHFREFLEKAMNRKDNMSQKEFKLAFSDIMNCYYDGSDGDSGEKHRMGGDSKSSAKKCFHRIFFDYEMFLKDMQATSNEGENENITSAQQNEYSKIKELLISLTKDYSLESILKSSSESRI